MGSTERDQTTQHHPPHISSLVVRPSVSNDEESGRNSTAAEDYEPGEVTRDRPSFPRSDRNKGSNGHRTRASSSSPTRRGYEEHRHGSDLKHSGAPPRGRGFSSRREAPGRHRDYSPPYPRGAGGRPYGRGLDGPGPAHGSEGMSRSNNPKVQPRDGDWYCLDPLCRNLNFARREYCNKCKRHRYAPNCPPLPRLLPPPMDHSPRRDFNGYRSPPRGWPRDYPPSRHDPPTWRDRDRERDHRLHYSEHEYPSSRRRASDWVHTEPLPKPHYERRQPPSPPPPPPPPRGTRWGRLPRERSRSPSLRDCPPLSSRGGGPPPVRDYRRDSYFDRGEGDDRRGGGGRHRMGNSY